MEQKFSKGEIVICEKVKMRILDVKQRDGKYWVTVTPTDWEPIGVVNNEVPQEILIKI